MKKVTASSNTSCCASTKKWATSPQRNSRHRQSNSMLIWRRQLHLSVDFNKVANPWKTFCPRWLQTTTAWSLSAPTGLTQIAGIWHTICYSVESWNKDYFFIYVLLLCLGKGALAWVWVFWYLRLRAPPEFHQVVHAHYDVYKHSQSGLIFSQLWQSQTWENHHGNILKVTG